MGFLLFASLAIALILSNAPRHYRYFCPVPPTCIHCKYDLSGSIGAHSCPECGLDWHSATSRREASSRYALDGPRAGRALLAWAALILFAILSRPIAIALISLNYYTSGFRNINFINVALHNELRSAHPMTSPPSRSSSSPASSPAAAAASASSSSSSPSSSTPSSGRFRTQSSVERTPSFSPP